jgi:ferredoxin--NADP+ reductase
MPKMLEYNATLVEREDITPLLAVFRLRPDEPLPGEGAWFVPGQYMVIGLNNEGVPELGSVRRPMSIASAPERRDLVEFYIRYVERPESTNPLTHLLWKTQPGDRMYARVRPTGKFTIADTCGDDDPRLKVMVAAGTGLAPFLSIARSRFINDATRSQSDLALIHGVSYSADLGYRAEIEELVAKTGLHYLPTVSRADRDPDGWDGHAGRAESFFLADELAAFEEAVGLGPGGMTPDKAVILICGLQGTIGATITRLLGRGFIPDNRRLRKALEVPEDMPASVFYEAYDTTPPVDVKDIELIAKLKAELHGALGSGDAAS